MAFKKRLDKELRNVVKDSPVVYFLEPINEENLYSWQGCILGPENSSYEGGLFYLKIQLSGAYPFKPAVVRFQTPILHLNIHDGGVSLDILGNQWSPALTISKVLVVLRELLSSPNPDDPLIVDLAQLYKTDREAYEKKVKEHSKACAIDRWKDFSLINNSRKPLKQFTLMRLCRREIRDQLRNKSPILINDNIKGLPLPSSLKNYLMFIDGYLEYQKCS